MHVSAHLFEHGIQAILSRQKKTVVLVTHQLQYLPDADKVIIAMHSYHEKAARIAYSLEKSSLGP